MLYVRIPFWGLRILLVKIIFAILDDKSAIVEPKNTLYFSIPFLVVGFLMTGISLNLSSYTKSKCTWDLPIAHSGGPTKLVCITTEHLSKALKTKFFDILKCIHI